MVAIQIPPSNQVTPGSQQLRQISFPSPVKESALSVDPHEIVSRWASSFTDLIAQGQTDVSKVFLKDSYWRDLLCLTWNFHTLHGPSSIQSFITDLSGKWRIKSFDVDTSSDFRQPKVAAIDFPGTIKCIQSFVAVETDVGRASGLVRLLPDETGSWKCYTLLTILQELKGHEELNHTRRPRGADNVSRAGRSSWKDRRNREEALEDHEPAVLIIGEQWRLFESSEDRTDRLAGCGQAGLTVAARLRQLGVKSLIIDRMKSVGDNWRKRYHHLVLHDSVWYVVIEGHRCQMSSGQAQAQQKAGLTICLTSAFRRIGQ